MVGFSLSRTIRSEQLRGALAGVGKVDMRIGVVDGEAVDLPQHAVGEDAVQVERDDDRHVLHRRCAGSPAAAALGVELAVRAHGAVQREVDAVDTAHRAGLDRLHDLGRKPRPARRGEQARLSGARAPWSGRSRSPPPRSTGSAPPSPVFRPSCASISVAALDVKVLVARRQRVEGRDLLHALGDQDPRALAHAVLLEMDGGDAPFDTKAEWTEQVRPPPRTSGAGKLVLVVVLHDDGHAVAALHAAWTGRHPQEP